MHPVWWSSGALVAMVLGLVPMVLGVVSSGCTVQPSGSDIPAPRENAVYVFYPSGSQITEGLVNGRGLRGALAPPATHAVIESHPTGHSVVVPVEPDGSFEFRIIAISGDVLEIRGATSREADELGAPLFVRVPATIEPFSPHVCCVEEQTCQTIYERMDKVACEPLAPGVTGCRDDIDCAVFEGEYLPLRAEDVLVSAPSSSGMVTVEGSVLPNVLVSVANVGKRAVLGPDADPGVRRNKITDDNGRFSFDNLPAVADDEVVVQLYDLNGFRSPPYALRVPDPELTGVDILGVFAWEPLTNGQVGRVAVRVSPYGADGRGICPDRLANPDGLELCQGGGLEHNMVTIDGAQLDRRTDPAFALNPVQSSTDANTPHNRGIEGDVRSKALDLLVVLDMSASARSGDAGGLVFEALRSYVGSLRARDRVGLITFGETVMVRQSLTEDRGRVGDILNSLSAEVLSSDDPRRGDNRMLDAVAIAAERLADRNSQEPARIVVITFDAPAGTVQEAREQLNRVLDVVERKAGAAFDGYRIDVVGIQLSPQAPTLLEVEDLATFSGGRQLNVDSTSALDQALSDLRGEQVGSFILLYDMQIPEEAGKAGTVFLDLAVSIPGSANSVEASYQGPLRIANAANP